MRGLYLRADRTVAVTWALHETNRIGAEALAAKRSAAGVHDGARQEAPAQVGCGESSDHGSHWLRRGRVKNQAQPCHSNRRGRRRRETESCYDKRILETPTAHSLARYRAPRSESDIAIDASRRAIYSETTSYVLMVNACGVERCWQLFILVAEPVTRGTSTELTPVMFRSCS